MRSRILQPLRRQCSPEAGRARRARRGVLRAAVEEARYRPPAARLPARRRRWRAFRAEASPSVRMRVPAPRPGRRRWWLPSWPSESRSRLPVRWHPWAITASVASEAAVAATEAAGVAGRPSALPATWLSAPRRRRARSCRRRPSVGPFPAGGLRRQYRRLAVRRSWVMPSTAPGRRPWPSRRLAEAEVQQFGHLGVARRSLDLPPNTVAITRLLPRCAEAVRLKPAGAV